MPAETPTASFRRPTLSGSSITVSRFRTVRLTLSRLLTPGKSHANSSPPRRAAVSVARKPLLIRAPRSFNTSSQAGGDQDLDLVTDQLLAPVTGKPFRPAVGICDRAIAIRDHHGVRHPFEEFVLPRHLASMHDEGWAK